MRQALRALFGNFREGEIKVLRGMRGEGMGEGRISPPCLEVKNSTKKDPNLGELSQYC